MLKILICADAQPNIGTGHLRRMLTFSKELVRNDGIELTLQTSELGAEIASGAIDSILVASCNVDGVINTLIETSFDAVVLDNYHWNAETTAPLRSIVSTIMIVDDLADRKHIADILLDQNAHHTASKYQGLVPQDCKLLVGAEYCLLSEEFRNASNQIASPKISTPDAPIFLSLGGGDPNNDLARMLKCVLEKTHYSVSLATGSHINDAQKLRRITDDFLERVELVFDSKRVVEQMMASQFAVAAGGTMTWERASLGLPSLCLVIADNQIESSNWLKEQNVHSVFDARSSHWDKHEFVEAILEFGEDQERQSMYSTNSKSLISGEGVVRTAQALISVSKSRRK